MKNNPNLLQVAEVNNARAYLTTDAGGKVNEDNYDMNIIYIYKAKYYLVSRNFENRCLIYRQNH